MVSEQRLESQFKENMEDVSVVSGISGLDGNDWIVDFRLAQPASRGLARSTLQIRNDFVVGGSIRFAGIGHLYDGDRHIPAYADDPLGALRDAGRTMARVYLGADPPPVGVVRWQVGANTQTLGLSKEEFREEGVGQFNNVKENPAAPGSLSIRIQDPGGGIHPHFDIRDDREKNEPEWLIGPTLDFLVRVRKRFLTEYEGLTER